MEDVIKLALIQLSEFNSNTSVKIGRIARFVFSNETMILDDERKF